jgi:hypothetical protein
MDLSKVKKPFDFNDSMGLCKAYWELDIDAKWTIASGLIIVKKCSNLSVSFISK